MERLVVWKKDNEYCSQLLKEGKELPADLSQYGRNDFYIEAMMGLGLWDAMTDLYPNLLKKENGKDWKIMNGVVAIKELMRMGRISECGKVIGDGRLMTAAGFNMEEYVEKQDKEKDIVTTDTIRNHLKRIDKESSMYGFYRQIKYIREQKWIRGKTYVADGHYITIKHGRDYEELGKVGEAYGYKVVVLLNIEEGRERVAGFALGPLQISERELLRDIFKRLEESVAPIRDIIDLIILDRGYWGAELLRELKEDWGIDFVTLARDEELSVSKDIKGLTRDKELKWHEVKESRSRGRELKVELVGFEEIEITDKDDKVCLKVNVVAAKEYEYETDGKKLKRDEQGQVIEKEYYYVTSLKGVKSHPYKIRKYYLRRWIIESRFRDMTQQLFFDITAGHKINAIIARIAFMLMMFNAEKIVVMKYPGEWEKASQRLRKRKAPGLADGTAVIVYSPDNKFGVYSTREYKVLIQQGDEYKFKNKMAEAIRRKKDTTLEEFFRDYGLKE